MEIIIICGAKRIKTHGIVDTASDRTCMNRKFVTKHGLEKAINVKRNTITGSNGKQFKTAGEVESSIEFNNGISMNSQICVIDELPVQVLLGVDCLARLGTLKLNAKEKTVMDQNGICLINKSNEEKEQEMVHSEDNGADFHISESVFEDSVMTADEIQAMKALMVEYRDIFCEKKKEAICENYLATIPLKEELGTYIYTPSTTLPLHYVERARKVIETWLEDGKIEPCQSSFNSRILCVPKPLKPGQTEPDLRVCIDYRRLNSFLPSDPVISRKLSDLMVETPPHKYRSSYDLPDAYLQIKIKPEDRHKTSFIFEGTQYQFVTLPFGLRVSGSSFIRVMMEVMEGLDPKEIRSYVDDILLTNKTFEEHLENTKKFFERCRIKKVKLSTSKAAIGQKKIKFLGIILQEEGFGVNTKKVQAICEIEAISSLKELRSFIGMCSFWRRWIPNLSARSINLTEALKKSGPFEYTEDMKREVEDLKKCLISPPILSYVDLSDTRGDFILYADANDQTAAWCLTQKQKQNGEWTEKAIAYGSNKFDAVQNRYAIHRKELLAIKIAVKQLRHLLLGIPFIIKTDSVTVMNYLQPKAQVPKELTDNAIIRMCIYISSFDFKLEKISSKDNMVADALTRLPKAELDTTDISTSDEEEMIFFQSQKKTKRKKKENIDMSNIMKMAHDKAGHPGVIKSLRNFRNLVEIADDEERVRRWIETCEFCQFNKSAQIKGVTSQITRRKRPQYPFQEVQVDITHVKLTSTLGMKYVIGIICERTSYAKFAAMKTKTAKEVAAKMKQYLASVGLCTAKIHTDDGKEFMGDFKVLVDDKGIVHTKATPYWKNKNCIIERAFRSFREILAALMADNGKSWLANLETANKIYNATPQIKTGLSPFQAAFGQIPREFSYLMDEVPPEEIKRRLDEKWKEHENDHIEPKVQFPEGTKVLVRRPPVSKNGYSAKYGERYQGPFVIVKTLNPSTYLVEDRNGRNFKANIRQLRKFRERYAENIKAEGMICFDNESDYVNSSEDDEKEEEDSQESNTESNQEANTQKKAIVTKVEGTENETIIEFADSDENPINQTESRTVQNIDSASERTLIEEEQEKAHDQIEQVEHVGKKNKQVAPDAEEVKEMTPREIQENEPIVTIDETSDELNISKAPDEEKMSEQANKNKSDGESLSKDQPNEEKGSEIDESTNNEAFAATEQAKIIEVIEKDSKKNKEQEQDDAIKKPEQEHETDEESVILKAETMTSDHHENGQKNLEATQSESILIDTTAEFEESKFNSAHMEHYGDHGSAEGTNAIQDETLDLSSFHVTNLGNPDMMSSQIHTPEKSKSVPSLGGSKGASSTPKLPRVPEIDLENEPVKQTLRQSRTIDDRPNKQTLKELRQHVVRNSRTRVEQVLHFIPFNPADDKRAEESKPVDRRRPRRHSLSMDRKGRSSSPVTNILARENGDIMIPIKNMKIRNLKDLAAAYDIEVKESIVDLMKNEIERKVWQKMPEHPHRKGTNTLLFNVFIMTAVPTVLEGFEEVELNVLARQMEIPTRSAAFALATQKNNKDWLKRGVFEFDYRYEPSTQKTDKIKKLNEIFLQEYPEIPTSETKKQRKVIIEPKLQTLEFYGRCERILKTFGKKSSK